MANGLSLVEPLIPDAQKNRAPDLFLEGSRVGLQAATQFAEMRRRSELAMAELATKERMSQEDHSLKLRDLELRADMIPYQQRVFEARENLLKEQADAWSRGEGNASQRNAEKIRTAQTHLSDADAQAMQLKLFDADYAAKHPLRYASGFVKYRDMFGATPLPIVKQRIKEFERIADQQKISMWRAESDGFDGWKKSGEAKQVPFWQVYQNIIDPATQAQTWHDLEVSGHMTGKGGSFDLRADLKAVMEKEKGTKFERAKSRVPLNIAPGSELPAESLEPDLPAPDILDDTTGDPQARYQTTETDTLIAQARAAITKGAPMQGVAEILRQNQIDPSVLFS